MAFFVRDRSGVGQQSGKKIAGRETGFQQDLYLKILTPNIHNHSSSSDDTQYQ
jgi:hypothetical protein